MYAAMQLNGEILFQNKPWKEIIYIKDAAKLEARVCGASWKDWSVGQLRETRCGFQFGSAPGVGGYVGLIDDVGFFYNLLFFFYFTHLRRLGHFGRCYAILQGKRHFTSCLLS